MLIASPDDLAAAYEKVTALLLRDVVDAWPDREGTERLDVPGWLSCFVEVDHQAVPAAARAVKCNPSRPLRSADKHHPLRRQPVGHFVTCVDASDNPPPTPRQRQPMPPADHIHACHVCSKNGSVMPMPSLPAAGWQ